jgi:hypothetical protein
MEIATPADIASIAWQGQMVIPPSVYAPMRALGLPTATLGAPEVWPLTEVLQNADGENWQAPDASGYWLLRLAMSLREPAGMPGLTEAQHTLHLHPQATVPASAVVAPAIFPEQIIQQSEVFAFLSEDLRIGTVAPRLTLRSFSFAFRKLYMTIQGSGVGSGQLSWLCKRSSSMPIKGAQYFYAIVVARPEAQGVRAHFDLVVTIKTQFGLMKFVLPEAAKPAATLTLGL